MSSVSSHDESDQDSLRNKTHIDGVLPPRYATLRKTDLLDAMDSLGRNRDTDSWSMAATIATIDDQDSVSSTSGNGNGNDNSSSGGGLVGISNDDMVTLDIKVPGDSTTTIRVGDDNGNSSHPMELDQQQQQYDDDDRRSRSNAAEFGDGGARSTGSDYDMMINDSSDDGKNGNQQQTRQPQQQQQQQQQLGTQNTHVINDSIPAPPQPQPSFSLVTKSYVELLEENNMLQTQIRNQHTMQKHQAQVIAHLRSLANGSEKAIQQQQQDISMMDDQNTDIHKEDDDRPTTTTTMTTLLEQLYERLHQFVTTTVELRHQPSLEQELSSLITDTYLVTLPFGTHHQQLLNTAYRDQLWRFQSTLGASFATWYRRQTVQSLSLNPATKEYLDQMQHQLTLQLMTILTKYFDKPTTTTMDQGIWMEILHWCRVLALKLHGDEADVMIQQISTDTDFDPRRMTAMIPLETYYMQADTVPPRGNKVKYVLNPLFIDEDDQVLLSARVVLVDNE